MPHLVLSLLGTLAITLDGQPAPCIESDKARGLLVRLALEPERAFRREALSALLWPEAVPAHDIGTQLLAALRQERRELLLVLDNFEQLLPAGGAAVILEVLRVAPHLTALVTSRERLNLQAESVLALAGGGRLLCEEPGHRRAHQQPLGQRAELQGPGRRCAGAGGAFGSAPVGGTRPGVVSADARPGRHGGLPAAAERGSAGGRRSARGLALPGGGRGLHPGHRERLPGRQGALLASRVVAAGGQVR